jgi:predicted transcriptional regulator
MQWKPLLCITAILLIAAIVFPVACAQTPTFDPYGPDNVIDQVGDYYILKQPPPDAIVDDSGADGTITFWQLPMWIQVEQLTSIAAVTTAALVVLLKLWPLLAAKLKTSRDNKIRDLVYDHIRKNPGSTVADIARKEGLNLGTVRYHVGQLQATHRINLVRSSKFVRIFQNSNTYSDREKAILSAMNRPTALAMIEYLHGHPGTSNPEIADHLKITDSGTHVQLKKLLRDGIVRTEAQGRFLKYYLKDDVKALIDRQSPV